MSENNKTSNGISWHITLDGREWTAAEMHERWDVIPEKFEVYNGKMFFSDEARINCLRCLLEHVGVRNAVRIGSPKVWQQAIEELLENGAEAEILDPVKGDIN